MTDFLTAVRQKNPHEKEYLQAVEELYASIQPALEKHPSYRKLKIPERMAEPERVVIFRVPWEDDSGEIHINRGYRVQMNSAIGPYKGGLRFHKSVTLSILKFLAFEQIFKNALTGLPLGAGKGGADFSPNGKSDREVMRFCQSFMNELFRHIGAHTDVPAGDMGVGAREIGFLFGQYKKLQNEWKRVLTGKGLSYGGSFIRTEATGYGCVYFAAEMLHHKNEMLEGKVCLVSGAGNVAQHVIEKLQALGAKVVTVSDSGGYIFDEKGIDGEKLKFIMDLKNSRRGRISEYAEAYPDAVYVPRDENSDHNPIWTHAADCAFPCAVENEINATDAQNLVNGGVKLVCEGANMPCSHEAIEIFTDAGIMYAPGKASNAGGVATSGLEMSQNSLRMYWLREDVDKKLHKIMKDIHTLCLQTANQYGKPGNYQLGANIAGFTRVADAMIEQGIV